MNHRRTWLKAALAGSLAFLPLRRGFAQQGSGFNGATRLDDSQIAPLEDQLKNGLRVVTPAQHKFVKVVVAYVKKGIIPRAMVNLVYKWALERSKSIPFPYFEFAMRALSKRRGITLP